MDKITPFIGPVTTLIGAAAPVVSSLVSKPSMPKLDKPTPVPTPTMPTKDDATARAAALTAIAKRSSQKGRQSTNLYEKETLGS